MTATQDTLFGDTPTQPPARRQRRQQTQKPVTKLRTGHQKPPRRDKEWNELVACQPTCLACGTPEPPEDAPAWPLCPATHSRCATVCAHTADAFKADVCLITTHVTARLMTLPNTGLTTAVVTCPHCGTLHPHNPTPGTHYRTSRCRTSRKPYIVHVPEESQP